MPASLILALALASPPETSEALAAWDKGCAAIRSYDVVVRTESTTFLNPDNRSGQKAPLKEAGVWRQVFRRGHRRIEQQVDVPSQAPASIFISDGDVARSYYPGRKHLILRSATDASPEGAAFLDYEVLYRNLTTLTYCDILRERPATRVESATADSCVLYSPPLIGEFEYAPFGFRVTLETSKNSLPRRIEMLLSDSGKEIVRSRLENTLAEVSPGVWAPVKAVSSTYPATDSNEPTPRKSAETVAVVDLDRSSFNQQIADRPFHLEVPSDARIEDLIGIGRAGELFGKSDDPRVKIGTAVLDSQLEGSRVLLMLGLPGDRVSQQLAVLTDITRPAEGARLGKAFGSYRAIGLAADDRAVVKILADDFGIDVGKSGLPLLVVVDGDGRVIASERVAPWKNNARIIDIAPVAKLLSKHAPDIQDAEQLLKAALARAGREQKRVFLQVSGMYCSPCLAMSRFLYQQKQIIDQHYVVLKIGAVRQAGVDAVIKPLRSEQSRGIPWVAILDTDGKVLSTSDDDAGRNTGFDNDHFLKMLSSTAKRMTPDELRQLRDALNERRKKPAEPNLVTQ